MADMVFDIHTQFGKGLVVAVRLENRIIAEALSASALPDNLTLDDTFELMDFLDSCTTTLADVPFLY
jgi:hypothetical protein